MIERKTKEDEMKKDDCTELFEKLVNEGLSRKAAAEISGFYRASRSVVCSTVTAAGIDHACRCLNMITSRPAIKATMRHYR
jgi:hypothetical protein